MLLPIRLKVGPVPYCSCKSNRFQAWQPGARLRDPSLVHSLSLSPSLHLSAHLSALCNVVVQAPIQSGSFPHAGSINSVAWAPYELGLIFACASSDGNLSTHMYNQTTATWSVIMITNESQPAHATGATAVSFAPAMEAGALVSARASKTAGIDCRLASAGCDNAVRLWGCGQDGVWHMEGRPLLAHTDWVRDVQWAPNLGLPRSTLASCGQDGKVIAWTEEASNPGEKHKRMKDLLERE